MPYNTIKGDGNMKTRNEMGMAALVLVALFGAIVTQGCAVETVEAKEAQVLPLGEGCGIREGALTVTAELTGGSFETCASSFAWRSDSDRVTGSFTRTEGCYAYVQWLGLQGYVTFDEEGSGEGYVSSNSGAYCAYRMVVR